MGRSGFRTNPRTAGSRRRRNRGDSSTTSRCEWRYRGCHPVTPASCGARDSCKATLDKGTACPHLVAVIGRIRHKGLRNYWTKGQAKGLDAAWIRKLRRILSALEAAERPEHMNYPGSYFHSLKGGREGRFSVRLTANFRVTFGWDEDGAVDVDIEDYHR